MGRIPIQGVNLQRIEVVDRGSLERKVGQVSEQYIYALRERKACRSIQKNLALTAIAEACRLMFNGVSLCE